MATPQSNHPIDHTGEKGPCVGIFWRVSQPGGPKLVSDVVALDHADEYGDFLTHPTGHYEIWEGWKDAGVSAIRELGLPIAIATSEYEEHPRGRVVYNQITGVFTIYADKRLQGPDTIMQIAELFGIQRREFVVRSDSHYVRTGF